MLEGHCGKRGTEEDEQAGEWMTKELKTNMAKSLVCMVLRAKSAVFLGTVAYPQGLCWSYRTSSVDQGFDARVRACVCVYVCVCVCG